METPYQGTNKHIEKALRHLSNRETPDYHNSIKESISAVESLAKEITGNSNGTLSQLVAELPLQHDAFSSALKKLYGFTSDAEGIRHSLTGEKLEGIDQNLARFMLIICSAFVNYIIANIAQEPHKSRVIMDKNLRILWDWVPRLWRRWRKSAQTRQNQHSLPIGTAWIGKLTAKCQIRLR